MMYLYFKNSRGIMRPLLSGTEEECWAGIKEFLRANNYTSCYYRVWETEPGVRQIDVGSWSEFFYISDHELEVA